MTWSREVCMVVGMGVVALGVAAAPDARACGGCFHADPNVTARPENTVVTGHRMAVSISATQTVLWDSVSYDGDPSDFAWVLPVGPGARIELASNAFFETLEAATQVTVAAPRLDCGSSQLVDNGPVSAGGCGSTGGDFGAVNERAFAPDGTTGDGRVQVLSEQTVGPYEVVTLRSTQPGALVTWLRGNHYVVPETISPVIGAYEDEGADFMALRLQPNQGVRSMKPVRVVYPGPLVTFPLRMVQAGTGATTGVVLYFIGEGRWGVENARAVELDPASLTYDFAANRSNYRELRSLVLLQSGNAWLTTYARRGALLSPVVNPVSGLEMTYVPGGLSAAAEERTVAGLYAAQALANGESNTASCRAVLEGLAQDGRVVVDPCDGSGTCRAVTDAEVDMRTLACGAADDLARALVGMRPSSAWLTRVEAELPRSALEVDLLVGAALRQETVENNLRATGAENNPCPVSTTTAFVAPLPAWPLALGTLVFIPSLRPRRRGPR